MADRPKVLFTPPLLRYSEVVLTGVIFVPERLAVTVAASYGELLQLPQVATGRQFWLRLAAAVVIPAAFAVLALRLRAVTKGGALAGMVAACCIFVFAGPPGFLVLATVFALTTLATRVGYSRKQHLGTAEGRRGRRASQVLANLSIAALASIGGISEHYSWLLACMVAALAEAAADTVSSECGQAWSDRVYLITSFRRVPVGTDGGISLVGTVCGVIAGIVVAWVSHALQIVPYDSAVMAGCAGILGSFVDSLLGATFERRRWLGNDAVNFLSTAIAAALAALFLL
ncbi:MAG TPA: DUF92 domain-containing protein [Terriglobales bacterium]|nr:DUF92 domain-containing protein [Terriglobales bacterium]